MVTHGVVGGLALGLWVGLALALGGGIGLGAIAPVGYVLGLVGGGVLAFGLARMVKGR